MALDGAETLPRVCSCLRLELTRLFAFTQTRWITQFSKLLSCHDLTGVSVKSHIDMH